ncbi:MAG: 16S rRNA processing protein RimM [Desulfobacter sp.]|nr:MAG: 16S rRNA processing protein RimM [Desulfobacter sp.]
MTGSTWLTIGKITGAHGLAGNLKVWSYADSPDTFAKGRKIMLRDEGGDNGGTFTIVKASPRKKGILLVLKEVSDRDTSESLVGKEILMDRAQLPELEDNTWYWEDLTGLQVTDHELGNLGKVDRLFSTGADDILVVLGADKTEVLIPMNSHFVDEVNLDAGKLTTTLPEGFITE